jgi:hypothetical protein
MIIIFFFAKYTPFKAPPVDGCRSIFRADLNAHLSGTPVLSSLQRPIDHFCWRARDGRMIPLL